MIKVFRILNIEEKEVLIGEKITLVTKIKNTMIQERKDLINITKKWIIQINNQESTTKEGRTLWIITRMKKAFNLK